MTERASGPRSPHEADGPEGALVRDLLDPLNLPGRPEEVNFTFTHGSLVFLTQHDVFKVKRAKDYGFFDYSSLAAREHFCHEEVRLNRRTAREIYLGVLPVYRDQSGHSLNRKGEVVDYAVHMRRLPDQQSALARLQAGRLGPADLARIASFVAGFHRRAPQHPPDPEGLRESIEENFAQTEPFIGRFATQLLHEETRRLHRLWFQQHTGPLALRPARDGHGDLRLEHVYLTDSGPLVIDCIEFLDRFRIADPALDAAFLVMDLYHQGRPDLAELFAAQFALESDDYGFYPLLDGYLSYRAWVRGKVACLVAADRATRPAQVARKAKQARALFTLSHRLVHAPRAQPAVIAVGGIIASGKSSLARALAREIQAPIVCADATRKHLAGIGHRQRGSGELYTVEFDATVQSELLRRMEAVIAGGRPVILDTTCRQRAFRERVRELAKKLAAPFLMVEVEVPEDVARQRLRRRGDRRLVSDAREELLAPFMASWEPITEIPEAEHVRSDGTQGAEQQAHRLRSRVAAWAVPDTAAAE